MATGRPAGRPRIPKGKTNVTKGISAEDLEKVPEVPEELEEDGQILWYKIWASASNWLTPADAVVILELCHIYEEKELYRRAIKMGSVPRVYKVPNGALTPHPYVKLLSEARTQMTSHLSSLGFNPTDRAKLGAMESLTEDPLVDLIARKRERENARRQEAQDNE